MKMTHHLLAGLLCIAAGAAGAQSQAGACSPAALNMGTIAAGETFAFTQCLPLVPVSGTLNQIDYNASFAFQLEQDAFFIASVQGTSVMPNQLLPFWSGIGITASLFYGDQFLVTGFGRGIGASEGPALLNPQFAEGFANADGTARAGSYEIRVLGNGFGPIPQGFISTRITADLKPDDPVTPVPEPATVAMQALGVRLLTLLLLRRRRPAQTEGVGRP